MVCTTLSFLTLLAVSAGGAKQIRMRRSCFLRGNHASCSLPSRWFMFDFIARDGLVSVHVFPSCLVIFYEVEVLVVLLLFVDQFSLVSSRRLCNVTVLASVAFVQSFASLWYVHMVDYCSCLLWLKLLRGPPSAPISLF